MKKVILIFSFIFVLLSINAKAENSIISNAKQQFYRNRHEQEKIKFCFTIADEYMELEQYDSAQVWLSKIFEMQQHSEEKNLFNYLVFTRQSEIYYYNNFLELGLQNSFQALSIAQTLNDSFLLADAYNFLGLFFVTKNQSDSSIKYLKLALDFAKDPPYPKHYLSISLPHHIYSNLSEAYDKKHKLDSALYYVDLSLKSAQSAHSDRGEVLAYTNKAKLYLQQKEVKRAQALFAQALQLSEQKQKKDILMFCCLGLAQCAYALNNFQEAELYINKAFSKIDSDIHLKINSKFRNDFLKGSLSLFEQYDNKNGIFKVYQYGYKFQQIDNSRINDQAQFIIRHSFSLEKEILALEVQKQLQEKNLAKNRFYLLALSVSIFVIVSAFVLYFYLKNKRIKLEKQKAILDEREKIIADLHDDVGGGLSSIRIISELLSYPQSNPQNVTLYAQKILGTVKDVSQKMSTFYWILNADNDKLQDFCDYVKKYAIDFFADTPIELQYTAQIDTAQELLLNSNQRKNLFLCVKEILNNALKHSQATKIVVAIEARSKTSILIKIQDNGIGINKENQFGNGLKNLQKRASEINADLKFTSDNSGTSYTISLSLAS